MNLEKEYDVVIVGGGPAGGQAARNLSKRGYKILLVEKHQSFFDNNFSSAGMTLEPLTEFDIPESTIGSYWNGLSIQCSKNRYDWFETEPKGVVLDFSKLREFLAEESKQNGGHLLLGYKYVEKKSLGDGLQLKFINQKTTEEKIIKTKIAVDATGPLRKVMYNERDEQPKMTLGSGTEYLIKVDQNTYDKFKEKLVFFLGHKWAIKGYSWIFPMENQILKVGAGKSHLKSKDQEETDATTKKITEKIIEEYIQPTSYELLDIHGGIVRYNDGLKDIFYKDKVVGVGDVVSAINPRGGEGIRYAMQSADLAGESIDKFLKTGVEDFESYKKKWRRKKLLKWRLSEVSARRMYNRYTDDQVENRVQFFHKNFSLDEMIDSLFNFKYNKVFLRSFKYFIMKLSYKINKKSF